MEKRVKLAIELFKIKHDLLVDLISNNGATSDIQYMGLRRVSEELFTEIDLFEVPAPILIDGSRRDERKLHGSIHLWFDDVFDRFKTEDGFLESYIHSLLYHFSIYTLDDFINPPNYQLLVINEVFSHHEDLLNAWLVSGDEGLSQEIFEPYLDLTSNLVKPLVDKEDSQLCSEYQTLIDDTIKILNILDISKYDLFGLLSMRNLSNSMQSLIEQMSYDEPEIPLHILYQRLISEYLKLVVSRLGYKDSVRLRMYTNQVISYIRFLHLTKESHISNLYLDVALNALNSIVLPVVNLNYITSSNSLGHLYSLLEPAEPQN